MGVAYHAHYLVWLELGRTELMRELGCVYAELEQQEGIYFPVSKLGLRYHAPARYDDWLCVRTRLTSVGGARVRFEYEVTRKDGRRETLIASGFTEHASVDGDCRPLRLPAEIRGRLGAGTEC